MPGGVRGRAAWRRWPLVALALFARPAAGASWLRAYGETEVRGATQLAATADGGLALACTMPWGAPGAAVLKTDAAGNLLWTRVLGPPNSVSTGLLALPDGGLLTDYSAYASSSGPLLDRVFVRLDALGNVVWSKSYGTGVVGSAVPAGIGGFWVATQPLGLLHLDEAGNVLGGKRYPSITDAWMDSTPTADGGLMVLALKYLIRVAGDGSVFWCQTYSCATGTCWLGAVVETGDGGFVVASEVDKALIGLDQWGTSQWMWHLDQASRPIAIRRALNGNVLAAWQANLELVVAEFSSAGAVTWSRRYSLAGLYDRAASLTPYDIVDLAGGSPFVAGELTSRDLPWSPVAVGADYRPFLARLDRNGVDTACAQSDAPPDLTAGIHRSSPVSIRYEDASGAATPVSLAPLDSAPAVHDICNAGCPSPPGEIRRLLGTKCPGWPPVQCFDRQAALWSWDADPAALGHDLWRVARKEDIPLARLSGVPTAIGVAGCAPIRWPLRGCMEEGALGRTVPVEFYQVRAYCNPSTEGP